MKLKSVLSAILVLTLFTGCLKSDPGVDPCKYDACALKVSAPEQLMVEDYLSSNAITGAVKHCSGMYYKIESPGSGAQPEVCSTIGVRYKGKLANGNVFDETNNPVILNLRQLIAGWKNGLPLIRAGGRITLYIPPTLGYGYQDIRDNQNNIVIPGGSLTIFEIDLTSVQ